MMDLFLRLFNMSVTASWLVLAVLIVRFFLSKAPKWIRGILWALVGVRLILPISFESVWSVIPCKELIVPTTVAGEAPTFASGIDVVDTSVNTYLQQRASVEMIAVARNEMSFANIWLGIWVIGIVMLLAYSLFSYMRLRYYVADAVKYQDNIYQSEKISSPFVLGFLHPGIYVPYHLEEDALQCVIVHEQVHIKRKDHLVKPFGFVLLSVYWFNPLIWVAYYYLCQDIELACDEKVIHELGFDKKRMYSQTLLDCSMERHFVRACPIAFGEIGVGKRVKNILEMKRTKIGIVITALFICVVVGVCFLSNPKSEEKDVVAKESTAASAKEEKDEQLKEAKQEEEAQLQAEKEAQKAKEAAEQEKEMQEEKALCEQTEEVKVGQFCIPFKDGADYVITALFSMEELENEKTNIDAGYALREGEEAHLGIDFAAPQGTEILSCSTGTVREVGFDAEQGNYVVMEDEAGYVCYYMHLETYSVKQGDSVTMGSVIGTVGSTGKSTGPHLHLGIQYPDGQWINPADLFGL